MPLFKVDEKPQGATVIQSTGIITLHCGYYLFGNLKKMLHRKSFGSKHDTIVETGAHVDALEKLFYKKQTFEELKKLWIPWRRPYRQFSKKIFLSYFVPGIIIMRSTCTCTTTCDSLHCVSYECSIINPHFVLVCYFHLGILLLV